MGYYRLTLTRVVFKCSFYYKNLYTINGLTLTRVVFKC